MFSVLIGAAVISVAGASSKELSGQFQNVKALPSLGKKDVASKDSIYRLTPNVDPHPDPSRRRSDPIPGHIGNATSGVGSYGWVEFKQCSNYWSTQMLGWCDGVSICNAGCAMTSTAMILATRGVGVDPGTLDDWLSHNGGYYDGIWLFVSVAILVNVFCLNSIFFYM